MRKGTFGEIDTKVAREIVAFIDRYLLDTSTLVPT